MPKIYLSSTWSDLSEVRENVYKTLRKGGFDVIAMEDYVAADNRPADKCLEDVRGCDLYIGLFAWRYGYIPSGDNKSITEMEYREAELNNIQTLIFLLHEDALWPKSKMDKDDSHIINLRNEFQANKLVSFFHDSDELCTLVSIAVNKHFYSESAKKIQTQLLRTPWLGIQFYQQDKLCPLVKHAEVEYITKVLLAPDPFEIRIPNLNENSIVMIAASWRPGFFEKAKNGFYLEDIPFFRGGTGMADTAYGDGGLMVNEDEEAHNHLDPGGRLYPGENRQGRILYSSICTFRYDSDERKEQEIKTVKGKTLYMVIHLNEWPKKYDQLSYDNHEKLILSF